MASTKIPVNLELRPAYYDDFHCLAAGCRLSCCKYWSITFSKKDYLSLKRQSGSPELNQRLEHGLRRIRKGPVAGIYYGEFNMDNGSCPLLREDCLCALQMESGHYALPEVCRAFPRAASYLPSGYLERSLSPACEGVLALLWDLPGGIEFLADPLPKTNQRLVWVDEEQPLLIGFQEIRSICIDLLQDRRRPLRERILLIGVALRELMDKRDVSKWAAWATALPESVDTRTLLQGVMENDTALHKFISSALRVLLMIQSSDQDFAALRDEILTATGVSFHAGTSDATVNHMAYLNARARYQEQFGDRDYFMENLMVALFFHLHLPDVHSSEALWKSFVNFCNLYSVYRFMMVMSCRKGAAGGRNELFRAAVHVSRALIHNSTRQQELRDEFFQNDSATLAHMAILLGG